MKEKVIGFIKKDTVLCVAMTLAMVSAFFVKPTLNYVNYIDFRVLGILLSLMTVMAGLQRNGLFDMIGSSLLKRTKNTMQLSLVLVFLCFFFSMFITNDVSLITFVPFAMLTLRKCNQVVGNREERRKVPSARYLRENDVAVVKQRLIDGAEIIAYQTGYVFYCAGDYGTVFPLFTCRDYVYEAGRKITVVKEDFFDNQPWYVRLILEGEDRLCRNREEREHNNCISYSHISEGWCELVDKRQNVLEKLIIEEAIGEFMNLLTDRQRQVIHQIYFQQRTQREVSRVFGITEPAVSKCISQAKQKMRRNAGRLIEVLQGE